MAYSGNLALLRGCPGGCWFNGSVLRESEYDRGTGCGNTARPGLCGGRRVTGVPTAREIRPRFPQKHELDCALRRNDMSFGLLQEINMLPSFPRIEDKFPMSAVLVYAARNLSGADRSAPVFKR